jgi:hypothetical protein
MGKRGDHMPNEQNMTQEEKKKKRIEELKAGAKKDKEKNYAEAMKQIATRDKLERDYKEDILTVSFHTSPETSRPIQARRPNQEEMMTIMRLSAEAAIYEGKEDPESLIRMVDIYDKLPQLAAKLSIDKNLDKDFWKSSTSFSALQDFITEVIRVTQRGTGIDAEAIEKFREKRNR